MTIRQPIIRAFIGDEVIADNFAGGELLGGIALALASVADYCGESIEKTILRLRAAAEMVAKARATGATTLLHKDKDKDKEN